MRLAYITFIFILLTPAPRQRYRSVPASRTPSSTPAGSIPESVRKAGRDKRNTFARAVTRSFDFIETFRAPSRSNKFPDVCPGSPLLSYPFFQPLFSSLGFAITERITLCLRNFPPVYRKPDEKHLANAHNTLSWCTLLSNPINRQKKNPPRQRVVFPPRITNPFFFSLSGNGTFRLS